MIHVLRKYKERPKKGGGFVRIGNDHVKISIRINGGGPDDAKKVCDEFERVIREKGLTREVIETPITVGSATGEIAAIDHNDAYGRKLSSGGEWVVS